MNGKKKYGAFAVNLANTVDSFIDVKNRHALDWRKRHRRG
jgi:hypothetical protein